MSTDDPAGIEGPTADEPLSAVDEAAPPNRPLRGAAAAQAGFDYQLDVSILAALQLLLISKAATRLVLEPAASVRYRLDDAYARAFSGSNG